MKKLYSLFLILILCSTAFGQSYLGTITKQVNFREGPGSDYGVLSSLRPQTQVFIISLHTENDYYNIINIDKDVEGYVHKSFVKVGKLISKSTESVFTPVGKTASSNAEVEVYNNTSKTLTLKMNTQLFSFGPQETKNINLYPGEYEFRASAPGVIPYLGTESLDGKQGYSWQFYISTSRR